jgi:hypothetical protein
MEGSAWNYSSLLLKGVRHWSSIFAAAVTPKFWTSWNYLQIFLGLFQSVVIYGMVQRNTEIKLSKGPSWDLIWWPSSEYFEWMKTNIQICIFSYYVHVFHVQQVHTCRLNSTQQSPSWEVTLAKLVNKYPLSCKPKTHFCVYSAPTSTVTWTRQIQLAPSQSIFLDTF